MDGDPIQDWWTGLAQPWLESFSLESRLFGAAIRTWLLALAVFAATFFALWIVNAVVRRRAKWLAERTGSPWAHGVVDILKTTRFWFLLAMAIFFASLLIFEPGSKPRNVLEKAAIVALVLQAAIWGNVLITYLIARYMKERLETDAASVTTMTAIGFLGKLALWALAVLMILSNVGVEVTALIAGLGIGGAALALASQNILADLFASLSIVLDKPFVLGDFITVGDMMGTVENVGLKTTRIRSLSGEQLVFPNGDLLQKPIRNFKRMQQRRVVFSLGVTYETPRDRLAAVPGILREAVEARQPTRFDRAHFQKYGDSALIFEVVYFVLSADYNQYMDIQQQINFTIMDRFAELGIAFAYPTQTLYVHHNEPAEAA